MNSFLKHFIKLSFLLTTLFFSQDAFAARLYFDVTNPVFGENQEVTLPLVLDPEGESINALTVELSLPSSLTYKDIYDGESVIETWVERPSVKNGMLSFSGIIPGGFSGFIDPFNTAVKKPAVIGNIVFLTGDVAEGQVTSTSLTSAYRNDGEGTAILLSFSPLSFSIKAGAHFESVSLKDITPPEAFIPTLGKDEAAFDGKYFVVFQAKDRGVGIDHYEVKEGSKSFITAESPYVLTDQHLAGVIVIRAVDKAGNSRLAQITPTPIAKDSHTLGILLGVFLLGVISYVIIRLTRRHKNRH